MKPTEHVRAKVTNDALIVLDLVNGQIFTANAIGARIWQCLVVDNQPKEQIVETIAREWETTPEIVAPDVERFVAQLKQRNLLTDA